MRIFMHGFLLFLFVAVLTTSCGKKEKRVETHDHTIMVVPNPDPTEPAPMCDPDPTIPQPDPQPIPAPIPNPIPVPLPEPIPEPAPVPPANPAQTFKVNVQFFGTMATTARKAKYARAMCVLKKVVATDSFKNKVVNYDSPYTVNMFYDSTNTPANIYKHILDGNEVLQPTKDNELDVEVQFYYEASSVVGYTSSGTKRIYVNTKFFDTYTPSNVAGNLMHEWLHKLGYKHSAAFTVMREYSVPYAIGYMVRDSGKNFESSCP